MTEKLYVRAQYLVETPLDLEKVADMMAGEQSSGTFVRVANETDELRERAAAVVVSIEEREPSDKPTLASDYLLRKKATGPYRRADVVIDYLVDNIGHNLPTLAATVAGNLYDLGEVTGLKLVSLEMPQAYRTLFPAPALGVAGTRGTLNIHERPLFGTIIKPNVGMSPEQIASLVRDLCEAGVDFVKDDEVCANPVHAPISERVTAVMAEIRAYRERTGREVMMAFNITDELDAMRRHAELVEREGGNCVMASLNWCGLSAMETLRRSTPLAIHGHRNGYGAFGRHPALGFGFDAYQSLYRLTGIDHMHVHGIGGKFADSAREVDEAARRCLQPLASDGPQDDLVMPVFSSGQWAGTLKRTVDAAASTDFMFLAGGGILAHPLGPAAGVKSLRSAYDAICAETDLEVFSTGRPELEAAIDFFAGRKT